MYRHSKTTSAAIAEFMGDQDVQAVLKYVEGKCKRTTAGDASAHRHSSQALWKRGSPTHGRATKTA